MADSRRKDRQPGKGSRAGKTYTDYRQKAREAIETKTSHRSKERFGWMADRRLI